MYHSSYKKLQRESGTQEEVLSLAKPVNRPQILQVAVLHLNLGIYYSC